MGARVDLRNPGLRGRRRPGGRDAPPVSRQRCDPIFSPSRHRTSWRLHGARRRRPPDLHDALYGRGRAQESLGFIRCGSGVGGRESRQRNRRAPHRGTIAGSIANADPSAESPLAAVTLGAEIMLATTAGATSMPPDDFFIGPMLTSIGQGECVSAIRFPVWPHKRIGVGFFEISARKSDFAFVAAAAQVALDEEGRCLDVALGVGGVGDRPLRLDVSSLVGTKLDPASAAEAVNAASIELDASSDLHASAAYRRRVAVTLCMRALEQARAEAAAKSTKGAR